MLSPPKRVIPTKSYKKKKYNLLYLLVTLAFCSFWFSYLKRIPYKVIYNKEKLTRSMFNITCTMRGRFGAEWRTQAAAVSTILNNSLST